MKNFSLMSIGNQNQMGTALVTALVILVVLTLLGISVMGNVSLEAKMAGNTQETNRALQIAETGLAHVYEDLAAFDLRLHQKSDPPRPISVFGGTAEVVVFYNSMGSKPRRGTSLETTYSADKYASANFEMTSTGRAGADATTVVRQGTTQITPKGEHIE